MNKKIVLLSLIITIIFTCFSGCAVLLGSLKGDIVAEIPNSEDVIIIREYGSLFSSSAAVYYKQPYKIAIKLGVTMCLYDASYQPFKEGEYKIVMFEDRVSISWLDNPNKGKWKAETFYFPKDE